VASLSVQRAGDLDGGKRSDRETVRR
jgi:hypothetical protein